jgi:hypothetical protein
MYAQVLLHQFVERHRRAGSKPRDLSLERPFSLLARLEPATCGRFEQLPSTRYRYAHRALPSLRRPRNLRT